MSDFHIRPDCRLCRSPLSDDPLLNLSPTPPANELLEDSELSAGQDMFPLFLSGCPDCGHVQLPVVVDPSRLFRDYLYVSGTSPSFVDHFRRYAESLIPSLKAGDLVVDVGSNDGTLLRFFKDAGMRVLGVDPARDIAARAGSSGIETVPDFLTPDVVEWILRDLGPASLVTANNVFAHADDLGSLADCVRRLIPEGNFVFEVQYLVDMCEKGLFDMVYHEHLSYHHVGPLVPFLDSAGLCLYDVERVPTHGGSIRCFAGPGSSPSSRVEELRVLERSVNLPVPGLPEHEGPHAVEEMGSRIEGLRRRLQDRLAEISSVGGRVAGYGAPAKAATLVHNFGLQDSLEYVVDDNPLKHGRHLPGTRVPVVPKERLDSDPPDYLLVLAWNFADPIVEKCAAFREGGGRLIVPLPEFKEIR